MKPDVWEVSILRGEEPKRESPIKPYWGWEK